MRSSRLLLAVSLALLTGCGQSTPVPTTPAASSPAPVAQSPAATETHRTDISDQPPPVEIAELPPAFVPTSPPDNKTPTDDVPTVPSEGQTGEKESAETPAVDADPVLTDVRKLMESFDFFNAAANKVIQEKILQLGDPGVAALVTLATSGPFDKRLDALALLPLFPDRLDNIAPRLAANLDPAMPPGTVTERVHISTIHMLARLGPKARAATPGLVAMLRSGSHNVKSGACQTLITIGEPRDEVVPALVEALAAKESTVRFIAAQGLVELHRREQAPAKVIAAFKPLLKDADEQVRQLAASEIGEFGPVAKSATPELTAALRDEDAKVRAGAAESLGKIGFSHPRIEAALWSCFARDEEATSHAAASLLKLGVSADADPAPLIAALRHERDRTREHAAELFARLKPADNQLPGVISALVIARDDEFAPVQSHVHTALVTIAKASPAAVDELHQRLKADELPHRLAAAGALLEVGADAKEQAAHAAEELFRLLRSANAAERLAAARVFATLAVVGPSAKPYVAELKKFADEEKDDDVKAMLLVAVE